MRLPLAAPVPLGPEHRVSDFASGTPALDEWLRRRALANQASGASRSYVACDDETIAGYYAIASGGVSHAAASGRLRRNMPDPIPVAILARLAVAQRHQGRGLGRALVGDAIRRVQQAADTIGIRGILVHAISQDARAFYLAVGFEPSPLEPMTLMAGLADIEAALR